MDQNLVKRLTALNQNFYSQFAHAFSETRSSAQTRLERVVALIGDETRVLDVGCGNGRLAERLDHEWRRVTYVGVDASSELIGIATARNAHVHQVSAEFRVSDLTQPGWSAAFAPASFDVIVMLAVLHHVPGYAARAAVMRDLAALLKPGGTLLMTNWQFERNDRQRKRIVAWSQVAIDERELEPGDALLAWRRGGVGYRYCHLVTKAEVMQLAEQAGLQVIKQFFADTDLNLYSILEK